MSVGDLKQRFGRPPCRQLLDRLAHAGDGAIGGMGFERRWHVVLSAGSCRILATPAASLLALADQVELPDFTASLVGSSTSGDLFICAKDLLVEANSAMWRVIALPKVTSYCPKSQLALLSRPRQQSFFGWPLRASRPRLGS